MFEKLIELKLTDEKRIARAKDLEVITFEKIGKNSYGLKTKGEKGCTHNSFIDFDGGTYDCSCADCSINSKVCAHLLRDLVEIAKIDVKLVERFGNSIDIKNFKRFEQSLPENPASYLPTGCKALDEVFGGGLPHQSLAIVYSDYNVGKSILCHQIAAMCWKLRKKKTLYIDTERLLVREDHREKVQSWFRKRWDIPDFKIEYRLLDALEKLFDYFGWTLRLRYGEKGKMDSIIIPITDKEGFPIEKSKIQVYKDFKSHDFGLIILDSITQPLEGLMGSGQEQFPGRKPILANLVSDMGKLSTEFNIPALITAHLSKDKARPMSPASFKGGTALGFGSKYIAYLKGGERIGPRAFKRDRAWSLEPNLELDAELKKDYGFT